MTQRDGIRRALFSCRRVTDPVPIASRQGDNRARRDVYAFKPYSQFRWVRNGGREGREALIMRGKSDEIDCLKNTGQKK